MSFQDYYNGKIFDYLIENIVVDDDYFDNLFAHYQYTNPMMLNEEVVLVCRNIPNRQKGHYDQYEIKIDQFLFRSYITYYLGKTFLVTMDKKVFEAEIKNYPILSSLKNIQTIIQSNLNNSVALISFVDGDNNRKLTGKVGHYTFSVMKGIEQSVQDSFLNNQDKKIFMIMFYVNKTEEKRLKLYSKMITNKLSGFKNEVIDSNTDPTNYIMYRF
jgi:hypothetical protein